MPKDKHLEFPSTGRFVVRLQSEVPTLTYSNLFNWEWSSFLPLIGVLQIEPAYCSLSSSKLRTRKFKVSYYWSPNDLYTPPPLRFLTAPAQSPFQKSKSIKEGPIWLLIVPEHWRGNRDSRLQGPCSELVKLISQLHASESEITKITKKNFIRQLPASRSPATRHLGLPEQRQECLSFTKVPDLIELCTKKKSIPREHQICRCFHRHFIDVLVAINNSATATCRCPRANPTGQRSWVRLPITKFKPCTTCSPNPHTC